MGVSSQYQTRCAALECNVGRALPPEPVRGYSRLSYLEKSFLLLWRHRGKPHLDRQPECSYRADSTDASGKLFGVVEYFTYRPGPADSALSAGLRRYKDFVLQRRQQCFLRESGQRRCAKNSQHVPEPKHWRRVDNQ